MVGVFDQTAPESLFIFSSLLTWESLSRSTATAHSPIDPFADAEVDSSTLAQQNNQGPIVTDIPTSSPTTPTGFTLGFLSFLQDPSGILGGYLLTNAWGRPLEFRLSTAVQPNRVQQILYGPTLSEYLHADLIGKTLVEKTASPPALIITDALDALALQDRLGVPVLVIPAEMPGTLPETLRVLEHERSSRPLITRADTAEAILADRLPLIDPAVDLAEPFARVREAIAEARKLGSIHRAA